MYKEQQKKKGKRVNCREDQTALRKRRIETSMFDFMLVQIYRKASFKLDILRFRKFQPKNNSLKFFERSNSSRELSNHLSALKHNNKTKRIEKRKKQQQQQHPTKCTK